MDLIASISLYQIYFIHSLINRFLALNAGNKSRRGANNPDPISIEI